MGYSETNKYTSLHIIIINKKDSIEKNRTMQVVLLAFIGSTRNDRGPGRTEKVLMSTYIRVPGPSFQNFTVWGLPK